MREGSEGVVRLSDIRSPVFRLLMHFIYSDELPDGSGRGPVTDNGYRASGPGRTASTAGALTSQGVNTGRRAAGTEDESGSAPSGPTNSTPPDLDGIDLDVAMTQHLLVAADRYDLTRLRAICESRLCDMVDVETAATTLALAEQNHAHALKRACLEYTASHLAEVMQTDGYKHMEQSCPQLASELLRTVALHASQQQQAAAAAAANSPLALAGAGDIVPGFALSPAPVAVAGATGGPVDGIGAGGYRQPVPRRRTTAGLHRSQSDSRGPACRRNLSRRIIPRKPPPRSPPPTRRRWPTRMPRTPMRTRDTTSMPRRWMRSMRTRRLSPSPLVREPGRGVRNRSRMGPPRVEGECEGERRTTTAEQTRSSDSAHWMRVRFNY